MHSTFRSPSLMGLLLLASVPFAEAETPLPDPIAPAVIGRPLDETWSARPVRKKPAAQAPRRPSQAPVARKAVPAPPVATAAVAPAAVQQRPAPQQFAKQALAALVPGAFFSSKDHALVRSYYDANPATVQGSKWKIGERVPERAAMTGVPRNVRAALSVLPPGHQYVQVDGEVVLVAVQSRIVVDGVSRGMR